MINKSIHNKDNNIKTPETMDEKVKQFLDEAKAKEQKATEEAIAKEKKEKNDFLVSLGLIKEKKREYSDTLAPGFSLWDPEAKKYYADVSIAVDVTEEEYEEIKKYAKLQNFTVDKAEYIGGEHA